MLHVSVVPSILAHPLVKLARGYKNCFMLNSTEYEIYNAINVKMPTITIVGILTFISTINTSEGLKARKIFNFQHFSFYELLKFHAQLSRA